MPVPPPSNAKRVHHGPIFDVWQWDQSLYDGSSKVFECAIRPDSAAVIPFLDAKTILLTKQRPAQRPEPFIDIPGGRIEPGEDAIVSAQRELQEETGHSAKRISEWTHYTSNGLVKFQDFLFIATDLTDHQKQDLDPGEKIELRPTPWHEAVQLAWKRTFRNPSACLAILAMEYDPEAKRRLQEFLRG
jgi:ADP-ribose pyrophosphatase